ncbi:MAG TPA: trypsin-like peptidase domain-containing protein [Candidatus Eremiobacteraceae bacterium]|nr:trypsin-like peptidase domain-containing protein [Candidatus Eremiobacteraceae bacterium]
MGQQVLEIFGWARRRKLLASAFLVLTLVIGILIGSIVSGRTSAMKAMSAFAGTNATPLKVPDPVPSSASFSGIVTRVEPAVVNIATTQVLEKKPAVHKRRTPQGGGNGQGYGNDQDDPMQDFFDRFFDGRQDAPPQAERSLGSGVIVDKRGYVLTNNHVVEQATKIQVSLDGDPNKYTAKVIGVDEDTDLAVIKIEAGKELPTAKLGNSDGVNVGDWVLAIGSPFGLNATVTAGIISAKDRGGIGGSNHQFQRFLQTDAAINPGNSGGPLVDLAGEVIGINTAIITGSRGYEGVGFALPSTAAINVYNQIIAQGRVTRGSIGVSFQEELGTNAITLKELGAANGVVIMGVEAGSPAEKAGLKGGDVITAVNGKPVKTGNDLVNPIAQAPIGSKVKIDYVRDRTAKEATAVVEDRTRVFPTQAGRVGDQQGDEAAPAEFGLRVEALTPDRASRVGMDGQRGVLVVDVDPASFADDLGFGRGDVIVEINRVPVASMEDYKSAVGKLKPGENVVFKVLRRADNDHTLTVFLPGVVPADSK